MIQANAATALINLYDVVEERFVTKEEKEWAEGEATKLEEDTKGIDATEFEAYLKSKYPIPGVPKTLEEVLAAPDGGSEGVTAGQQDGYADAVALGKVDDDAQTDA